MTQHDAGLRRLFFHREMAADLLTGFINEPWVDEVDLETLERVPGDFVSHTFRKRANDVIWRLRLRDQWLYIYLVLEFQSTVDPYMALRLWVYVGLLYQDLIASGQVAAGERLPPVVPIVLYNGRRVWTAAGSLAELIREGPGPMARYQPRLEYLLLEERAYDEAELSGMKNLVAALFRLENSRSLEQCRQVVSALKEWLAERNQQELAQSFVDWLRRIFLPSRLPEVEIPPAHSMEELAVMLEEQDIDWTREWREQGLQEGRRVGIKEGEAALLSRLLESKFGEISDSHHKLIEQADCDQLLAWGERVLTAERIEEVFRE